MSCQAVMLSEMIGELLRFFRDQLAVRSEPGSSAKILAPALASNAFPYYIYIFD